MKYKFLNQEQTIVGRIDDDGLMRISGDAQRWEDYLKWLEEGNEPLPPDPETIPEPPTAQQKLEAAGLTIEELKGLLGL
jgi:hypothetical protein